MNLVHPYRSAIAPCQSPCRLWVFATAIATLVGAMVPAWCAETVVGIVSENIAAHQRHPASLAITEVSIVRARLLPAGPAPLTSDGRLTSELAGVNYRVWISSGRADMGVGVGALGHVVPPPFRRIEEPVAVAGASPTLSVGLRYRVTSESAVYADASGTYGIGVDPNANYLSTKVGMEWKPAKHRLGFERGAIGIHFDSGYRLSVKPTHGGLGLYLRGQF